MSSNALESEDLENVQLVRMEDVQPSRETRIEILETCIVDNVDYDNECVVNDENSNIGSMVSIESEDVASGDNELIVSEVSEPLDEVPIDIEITTQGKTNPDRWPTLEILPGGVIKHADKCGQDLTASSEDAADSEEMMYACAKCSQSFKYLFCLVKHVKWHEDEQKRQKVLDMNKLNTASYKFVTTKRGKQIMIRNGYIYRQNNRAKNLFYCSKKAGNCKSRIKLDDNGVIIHVKEEHTHLPPLHLPDKCAKTSTYL